MFWNFRPWSQRRSEPEPRIHQNLTKRARIRLSNILEVLSENHIRNAYNEMVEYTGQEVRDFDLSGNYSTKQSQFKFIRDEKHDTEHVLDYLEYAINIYLDDTRNQGSKIELIHKIERTFVDEGILIQVKPSAEEIADKNRYMPSQSELLRFQQVSDETIIEADQEVRTLSLGETWKDPLKPYNKAWDLYKEDVHTTDILEKLYNSLELTTEKICAELNDWEEPEKGVGRYLHVLKQKGLFDVGPQLNEEVNHIAQSIEIFIHRMGGNRKKHKDIDPDYCILVLHQTSAYLSYIIKQYEQEFE